MSSRVVTAEVLHIEIHFINFFLLYIFEYCFYFLKLYVRIGLYIFGVGICYLFNFKIVEGTILNIC